MRFKEFLAEVTVDLSDEELEDPNAVGQKARNLARKAKRNPQAVHRDNKVQARAERQAAQASESPTKALDMRIAKIKEQLATLQQQRQRMSS